MFKIKRNKIILTLTKDEFNTIMIQLYYPRLHIAGIADEITKDLYIDAKDLYRKLDKEYGVKQ